MDLRAAMRIGGWLAACFAVQERRMRLARTTIFFLGVAAAACALPRAVSAQGGPAPALSADRLAAECAWLRAELDRTNAEISALKRTSRGFRADYRLRQKMADAEALARRLTAAEVHLGRLRGAPPAAPQPPLPANSAGVVAAAPGDGPIELEAKADLLSDMARKVTAEADVLARTAGQIRVRQTLRRRAGDLDRDPFAGLDATRRNIALGVPRAQSVQTGGSQETATTTSTSGPPPQFSGDSATRSTAGAPAPTTATVGAVSIPPLSTTATTTTHALPVAPSAGAPPPPTAAITMRLRALIDPATLAEVQRIEPAGQPLASAHALERAAAALRAKAKAIEAQAAALRAKANR